MTAIELITRLESFPPATQVLLDMTTDQMEHFKFVSIAFADEVGVDDGYGNDSQVIVLSHNDLDSHDDNGALLN
jgi:hypothetical protein